MNTHRVSAIIYRHLIVWRRSFERVADAFWWPTMNLFIWGLVNVYLQKQTGSTQFFVNLFLGGLLMWTLVVRSQEEMGIAILQEAWDRNLLNIFSSPITIWEYSTATVILAAIKLCFTFFWMYLLAYFLFAFNIFSVGWMLVPYTRTLMITGWWLGFFINGLILRYGYRVQVFAWTLSMILLPFSSVYYPVTSLPSWAQSVAWTLPTTYIFEGMRHIFQTHQIDFTGLVIATALNVVYILISIWYFSRSFKFAQKTGMIIKMS